MCLIKTHILYTDLVVHVNMVEVIKFLVSQTIWPYGILPLKVSKLEINQKHGCSNWSYLFSNLVSNPRLYLRG